MTAPTDMLSIFEPALQERQPIASRLLTSALRKKALSNGYLLSGRAVADKWMFAQQLAAFLNCLSRQPDDYFSCLSKSQKQADNQEKISAAHNSEGLCQNCQWIAQGEHPQAWLVLAGQGESGKIPVEKARLLTEELNKTSRYMRVVVIPQAEQEYLHAAPANALLKSIEEPTDNSLFLLFASSAEQVLPTIVSRSQVIPILSRFKAGFWAPAVSGANETVESQTKLNESLASFKSEFIHAARKRLSGTSSLHGSYIKAVSESQDLSDRLRTLSDDESIEPELLIDLFLAAELEVLREMSTRDQYISLYLSRLAELCEGAKNQLGHYVKKNNVLETFAYSLTELRAKYLGDFSLAKN